MEHRAFHIYHETWCMWHLTLTRKHVAFGTINFGTQRWACGICHGTLGMWFLPSTILACDICLVKILALGIGHGIFLHVIIVVKHLACGICFVTFGTWNFHGTFCHMEFGMEHFGIENGTFWHSAFVIEDCGMWHSLCNTWHVAFVMEA